MAKIKMWVHDNIIHDVRVVEELFDVVLPPFDKKELFNMMNR